MSAYSNRESCRSRSELPDSSYLETESVAPSSNPLSFPDISSAFYDDSVFKDSSRHPSTSSSSTDESNSSLIPQIAPMSGGVPWPSYPEEFLHAVLPDISQTQEVLLNASQDPQIPISPQGSSAKLPDQLPYNYFPASTPPSASGSSTPDPSALPDAPIRPRKNRREKPHLELAPDQPLTTSGTPRARVYVACAQCRNRKIRCDGAKPSCWNCVHRASGSLECVYDPLPKRRGPDKTPRVVQRQDGEMRTDSGQAPGPVRRRRRRPASSDPLHNNMSEQFNFPESERAAVYQNYFQFDKNPVNISMPYTDQVPFFDGTIPFQLSEPLATFRSYNNDLYNQIDQNLYNSEVIVAGPSLEFTRKTWWDSLLYLYSPDPNYHHTSAQRTQVATRVITDLRFLFRVSMYWFSFFHVPTFFGNLFDPSKREHVQPGLVLASLALSTFWQSSEAGRGREGRAKALVFRIEAQNALEKSINAGWIDETLAQTAWLLAMYEVCAHPNFSGSRARSSMTILDSLIRSMALAYLGEDDADTSSFSPRSVTAINISDRPDVPRGIYSNNHNPIPSSYSGPLLQNSSRSSGGDEDIGCNCSAFALQNHWASVDEYAPLWASTPAWDPLWSEGYIRKESCRRLCWSSMILATAYVSFGISMGAASADLYNSSSNYVLFFSGRSTTLSHTLSSQGPIQHTRDTIWALHDRAFLLSHRCRRMRHDTSMREAEKLQFGVTAWLEADAIEAALNTHTCDIESTFAFQAREFFLNIRMSLSDELRRSIPLISTASSNVALHVKKTQEWLLHQNNVAFEFMRGLQTATGLFSGRPFFIFWLMGQIARVLSLWRRDRTLLAALDVCKALIGPADYLTAMWPSQDQRLIYTSIRTEVEDACRLAGLPPPPLPNWTPSPEVVLI